LEDLFFSFTEGDGVPAGFADPAHPAPAPAAESAH
jgi:hypothetical protein